MQDNDSAAFESVAKEESTDIPPRAARALTEKMTALPEYGRAEGADDLFVVVSGSGSEYLVDVRDRVCECPDYQYREPENGCKHVLRCLYATGTAPLPAWAKADAIDPLLGEQTDADVRSHPPFSGPSTGENANGDTATDGGELIASETAETPVSEPASEDEPTYTYHYERAHVGGKRYVRCTVCGAECIPAKPSSLLHRDGCSEGQK